jgi:methylenetetrahydrofolate reductase (NADPH)
MSRSLHSLPQEAERQALAYALQESYMEVFPSQSIEYKLDVLAPRSYVAITCSPTAGVDATLDLTARVVRRGFRVVPHIAAKMVRDRGHLQQIMHRVRDLGVDSIFVPGGDAPRPLGPYPTARHLLREIAAKQSYANYFVTQMCFDASVLAGWLRLVRSRGITMTAWIGLPGVLDRSALLAASIRIGVGASFRLLRDRGRMIRKLLGPKMYRPDKFLLELAPLLAQPEPGIAGFHLFCFNRVVQSEDWRRQFVAALESSASLGHS